MSDSGALHVVFDGPSAGISARREGMEIRDCLLVIGPEGVSFGWLVRRPLDETIVEAVVSRGRGALCIDPCRIEGGIKQASAGALNGYGGSSSGHYEKGTGARYTSEGRFPSNTVLVHHGACRRVGVRTVAASNPAGQGIGSAGVRTRGVYGEGDPTSFRGNGTRVCYGSGGTEDVPAWACVDACLASKLDEARYYAQHGDEYEFGLWIATLLCGPITPRERA